jgi:hypothetical protein
VRALVLPSLPFGAIPAALRDPLLQAFNEIVRNFREGRWEPSELNGGKLCEIIFTILRGHVDGNFSSAPSKPRNMVDACYALQVDGKALGRSVSIQIPRMLLALYEIRNNRGVGHIGGDVNPNHMDAVVVLSMAKWLMAELLRIFHSVDTAAATEAIETLVEKTVPIVWKIDGKIRVLSPSLEMRDKTLIVLWANAGPMTEEQLRASVEYRNQTLFRQNILTPAHRDKLIDYDSKTALVHISPLGIRHVEENIKLEV